MVPARALSWSPVPALFWGAWLELERVQAGSWMPPLEFVLLRGLGYGVAVPWGVWLCFASWTQWGSAGAQGRPQTRVFGLIPGWGAWGTSDAVLIHSLSDSLGHGSCDGPVITAMGAGSRGMGAHSTASPQPAAPVPAISWVQTAPPALEGIAWGPRRCWGATRRGELAASALRTCWVSRAGQHPSSWAL